MKAKRNKPIRIKLSKLLIISSVFLFVIIIIQLIKLSTYEEINGVNLQKFANNRNTQKEILVANRGTIYNANNEPLAQTVNSYTVIAYLDSKRSDGYSKPQHVIDKEGTAEALAPLINMTSETILNLLKRPNLYQIELGPGGKEITELTKEAIEQLQLPGIDFIKSYKRYYPNNDFLSYTLGYVQKYDEILVGEMGLELYYNDYLKGKNGYLTYQKDLNGYRIPNTPEIKEDEVDGMDIYLTVDNNIQMFVERITKNTYDKYHPEWMLMIVADAKTGKILGTTSTPSFNPNKRDMKSYLNPLVSYAYEPGSTMKIFTYMAALEKGTYQGENTFLSGNKKIGENKIYDWERKGWGTISYDEGFALSSNVGAANIMENFITKNDLKNYLKLAGFGQKTDFTLPGEVDGKINFNYDIEVANAAFGQGITISPIQFIQALTAIANNGIMLKPYIIDKIVDPNTGKVIEQNKRTELKQIASKETINKIKELMYNVVNLPANQNTGSGYKIEGYDIIGKTGTAQYVDPNTGKYANGENTHIRSFAGLFPKDNPEVIIYTVVKHPSYGKGNAVREATKKVIDDVAKYLNLFPQVNDNQNETYSEYVMPNLLNQNINDIQSLLPYNNKMVIIGEGDKIVRQYPISNLNINSKDRIFIITNNTDITLPSFYNWAYRDILTYCNLINLNCQFTGYGYGTNQSIEKGTKVNKGDIINIQLEMKID
jgi:penicillin-binding protein 2B